MRTCLKALLLFGFGTIQMLDAGPGVLAADLAVQHVRKTPVRVVHRMSPIVRDLDGTPIMLRPARPVVFRSYNGDVLVKPLYEAIPVRRGDPSYYLNGEPVLPHFPRSWPRDLTAKF
jgi:hypothetical protein